MALLCGLSGAKATVSTAGHRMSSQRSSMTPSKDSWDKGETKRQLMFLVLFRCLLSELNPLLWVGCVTEYFRSVVTESRLMVEI